MEFEKIKELISIIDKSSLVDFELNLKNDFHIKMNKAKSNTEKNITKHKQPKNKFNENFEKFEKFVENNSQPKTTEDTPELVVNENCKTINSPIVGTFYSSSSPNKPAFVKVGDTVQKGDVLCIIEAMKVMNEIKSDVDGKIVEILVNNESMVEYNQPLFKIV